ncbi:MAG: heat-inducible transcriptional repressor HrcA [Bryobacter sp.]
MVEEYLLTGEPVASATIANKAGRPTFATEKLSPATIRNAMAELTERGYLSQPHTSAGRIPNASAIQHFVDSLSPSRFRRGDYSGFQRRLQQHESWHDRVEEGTHLLKDLTQNVSMSAALPSTSQVLHQVELSPLGQRQYLMIVVTADRVVHNQIITLEEDLRPEELAEIRNYINFEFSGWNLDEARKELELRLANDQHDYAALLRRVELFYHRGLLDCGFTPYVFLDGAAYLVGLDLHLTRERLRELFQTLEQKKHILRILNQYLEGAAERPAVKVGLGEAHGAMEEFSLVGIEVSLAGGAKARVAVLGPLRLNYPRVMAAVMEVGQALASMRDA